MIRLEGPSKTKPSFDRNLDRRVFISTTVTSAALVALASPVAVFSSPWSRQFGFIDVNINLSRWPLRRLRYDDTTALVSMLRRQGVSQAWTGSFDFLLHKDIASANTRLFEECRRFGRGILSPFGSINPLLSDWEEELKRCAINYRMAGIRLFPNYHGYKLGDPAFSKLLKMATERGMIVQIALLMEDDRMMHPLLRVEPVDITPLTDIVRSTPGAKLVLLNAAGKLHGKVLTDLIALREVYLEISMLEGVGGIGNLLEQIPVSRVLFGSYAPLFYFESALLKLKESALNDEQLNSIKNKNAIRLLAVKA